MVFIRWIIIFSIALVVMLMVVTARAFLRDDEQEKKKKEKKPFWKSFLDSPKQCAIDLLIGTGAGLFAGICCYFVLFHGHVAAIIVLLLLFVAMACVVFWWRHEGSELLEALPFIGILVMLTGMSIMASSGVTIGPPWLGAVLKAFSVAAGIVSIASICYNYFTFRCETVDEIDGKETVAKFHKAGAVAVVVIAVILILGTSIVTARSVVKMSDPWSASAETEEKPDESEEPDESDESDDTGEKSGVKEIQYLDCVHFRNSDLQNDSDKSNDYNLGYDHWEPGRSVDYYVKDRHQAYAGDEKGEKIDTLVLALIIWNYDKFLGEKNAEDLIYLIVGDDDLSSLSSLNAVSQALSTNQELLEKAIAMVDSIQARASHRIEKLSLKDQIYVQPESFLGRPKLVVYESDVKSDWCLIDTFVIKGKKIEIAYRIRCGYQTCNVAKTYGLGKVPKKPSKPSKPGKPGKGGNDKPKPKPKPGKPKKDQSRRSALPNDNKGSGENTIDPKDYEHSSGDGSDNSTSTSPEQYHNDNKDKGDAGKNQNTGGGSSDPSTDTGGAKDNHGSDADRKTDTSGGTAAGKDSDGKVDEPS